ncbi:MAG: NAD+ synthase [Cyanobacteriota bacterium]|nr:NAD+ synthase [Cyanobacteriota bacterium]
MRIALAQLNPLVGDLEGNAARLLAAAMEAMQRSQAAAEAAHAAPPLLLVTPELSLWGYPPRDLLLRPSLIAQQQALLDQLVHQLAAQCPQVQLLVGIAEPSGRQSLPNLFNAAALVNGDGWRVVCRKQLLPSYDVFDERRYFQSADQPALLELGGVRLGLTICEDLWVDEDLLDWRLAGPDPVAALQPLQPDLVLNLSASPFARGKLALRHQLAARAARRLGCPLVYVNQVGGNDELVFDGASFVITTPQQGGLCTPTPALQLGCCCEQVQLYDWHPQSITPVDAGPDLGFADHQPTPTALPSESEQLFRALVLGVADYARKCGFGSALLGLSGGIDSALVAVIAAAALGAERVRALLLPSPYSSAGSLEDAEALAQRLNIGTCTLPIAALMQGFDQTLQPALGGSPSGVAAENLQSRIRGSLLMAVANQQGQLLLSTGNKSELAVGYCTLYGDMNGGLAVIGDLYKTTVFELCAWLDSTAAAACRGQLGLPPQGELIGAAIRCKPPSAELRPDQKDSDSLPDYGLLDPLLKGLIEQHRSPEELIAGGVDAALAARVTGLLRRAEFKRRQAPPVLKVSQRSFGSGWRMPIAAR